MRRWCAPLAYVHVYVHARARGVCACAPLGCTCMRVMSVHVCARVVSVHVCARVMSVHVCARVMSVHVCARDVCACVCACDVCACVCARVYHVTSEISMHDANWRKRGKRAIRFFRVFLLLRFFLQQLIRTCELGRTGAYFVL